MGWTQKMPAAALAAVLAAGIAMPASASTFVRADLDYLVATNSTIVVGEALEAHSYWNKPGTLILTDVRFAVSEVLKGQVTGSEITVTLPGGTVGDESTVVVGGAELNPGKSYLIFLESKGLPGAKGVLTVSDHCQGAFDLQMDHGALRAVSQGIRHSLAPDVVGKADAVGGREGTAYETLRQSILDRVKNGAGKEVKK